jgi:two-component system response regulator VanR
MMGAAESPAGRPQPTAYLHLTAKETALLIILTRAGGAPVSGEQLLRQLYPNGDAGKNAIEVRVHKLRRKLRLYPGVRVDFVPHQGYKLSYID